MVSQISLHCSPVLPLEIMKIAIQFPNMARFIKLKNFTEVFFFFLNGIYFFLYTPNKNCIPVMWFSVYLNIICIIICQD